MNPESSDLGRTENASIRLLEPMEFDFQDGQPLPATLGQTGQQLNILSDWPLNGIEPIPTYALVLTFYIRSDAKPTTVTLDLFAAFAVLNRYEISLGGSGLVPDEVRSNLVVTDGTLRLVLTATQSVGAADRLTKLAAAVNESSASAIDGKFAVRSFDGCKAAVSNAA